MRRGRTLLLGAVGVLVLNLLFSVPTFAQRGAHHHRVQHHKVRHHKVHHKVQHHKVRHYAR
jgi:hypothetical protein